MKKNIMLLDCTLRDGGYINDWDFGQSVISGIYKNLQRAGVEFIEVGFLDDRRIFDYNKSIMPDTNSLNRIYGKINQTTSAVAMIDYGTCSIENISDARDSFIDGIRVIFKKEKIDEALLYCKSIKDKGYLLFIQAISITSYSDKEILDYIDKINEIKPYAFSIVDTYGLLHKETLQRYFLLLDNNLDRDIKIGYHAHNNFQLAYSNSIEFISFASYRDIIVDSTVYGMGKGAGNCNTELIMMYLNEYYNKNYKIDYVLEVIDTDLMGIYNQNYWGYKYNFYISALNKCHPNYVNYLLEKKTLSVESINKILSNLSDEMKLNYNKDFIEELYINHQSRFFNDTEVIKLIQKQLNGKNLLILGPGISIDKESFEVKKFIGRYSPTVIAINFLPSDYIADFIFLTNSKRYSMLHDNNYKEIGAKIIATSNIMELDVKIDHVLDYESLINREYEIFDNGLILCMNLLIRIGIKELSLAGFDGYYQESSNYYVRGFSLSEDKKLQNLTNFSLTEYIKKVRGKLSLNFITKSIYED